MSTTPSKNLTWAQSLEERSGCQFCHSLGWLFVLSLRFPHTPTDKPPKSPSPPPPGAPGLLTTLGHTWRLNYLLCAADPYSQRRSLGPPLKHPPLLPREAARPSCARATAPRGGSRALARRPLGVPAARPGARARARSDGSAPSGARPTAAEGRGRGRGRVRPWNPCGGPTRLRSGCCCAGPGPRAPPPARSPAPPRCWRGTCYSGACRTGPPSACPTALSGTTSSASRTSTGRCRAPTITSCVPAASLSSSTTAPRPPGRTWPGRTGSSRRSRSSTWVSGPGRWNAPRWQWDHCLQSTLTNVAQRSRPRPKVRPRQRRGTLPRPSAGSPGSTLSARWVRPALLGFPDPASASHPLSSLLGLALTLVFCIPTSPPPSPSPYSPVGACRGSVVAIEPFPGKRGFSLGLCLGITLRHWWGGGVHSVHTCCSSWLGEYLYWAVRKRV